MIDLPQNDQAPSPHQYLRPPQSPAQRTGPVRAMEWSSDGYVLAVGWAAGWSVWTFTGRCLASGVGVDEEIPRYVILYRCFLLIHSRFADTFMFGIVNLVSNYSLLSSDLECLQSSGYQGT